MKLNGKNGWALLLIFCGALILLNFLGPGIGFLLSLLFPLALIGLGVLGIKNGKSVIGWILVVIGLLSLLSRMSGWFGLLTAVVLIIVGLYVFRSKKVY